MLFVMQAMQNSQMLEEMQEAAGTVNKVEAAEAEVAELQRRVDCERQAFAQISANSNLIASTTHFDLQVCHLMARHHPKSTDIMLCCMSNHLLLTDVAVGLDTIICDDTPLFDTIRYDYAVLL